MFVMRGEDRRKHWDDGFVPLVVKTLGLRTPIALHYLAMIASRMMIRCTVDIS